MSSSSMVYLLGLRLIVGSISCYSNPVSVARRELGSILVPKAGKNSVKQSAFTHIWRACLYLLAC